MSRRIVIIPLVWFLYSLQNASAAPPITAAAVSPDGKHFLVGSQAGVVIHDAANLSPTGTTKTELEHVHDLQFSPDGKQLILTGGAPGETGLIEIISWPGREVLQRIAAHKDLVYRVAWSPSGTEFATASADGTCCVVDSRTFREQTQYTGHSRPVLAIAYLPDGKTLVSAGVDQTLQLWDSRTGRRIRALDNHLGPVNDLAVRPQSDPNSLPVVATVSDDRTVRLWQPTIGRLMRFAKLDSPPRCVAWSRDGSRIIVGCNDGSIRRIDPDTLEVDKPETGITGRIFTLCSAPDGKWLVGGEKSALRLVK